MLNLELDAFSTNIYHIMLSWQYVFFHKREHLWPTVGMGRHKR